jgi:hypothetical protein
MDLDDSWPMFNAGDSCGAAPSDVLELPTFWEMLGPDDQTAYRTMRDRLTEFAAKTKRARTNDSFCEILQQLKQFVCRGDAGDSIRGLVCGIVWLDDGIAINTHQFRLVSSKCKSSINAAFQGLGYGTTPSAAAISAELVRLFPFMQNNFALLRQWTIRQRVDAPSPKLSEIVHQRLSECSKQEEITPPPARDPTNDPYVNSYLNDQCTLGDMVRALIQSRKEPSAAPEPKGQQDNIDIEGDGLCFFQRDAAWMSTFDVDFF